MVITTTMIAVGAMLLGKEIERKYNEYKRNKNN